MRKCRNCESTIARLSATLCAVVLNVNAAVCPGLEYILGMDMHTDDKVVHSLPDLGRRLPDSRLPFTKRIRLDMTLRRSGGMKRSLLRIQHNRVDSRSVVNGQGRPESRTPNKASCNAPCAGTLQSHLHAAAATADAADGRKAAGR